MCDIFKDSYTALLEAMLFDLYLGDQHGRQTLALGSEVGSSSRTKGMRTVDCPFISEGQCGWAATGSCLLFPLLLPSWLCSSSSVSSWSPLQSLLCRFPWSPCCRCYPVPLSCLFPWTHALCLLFVKFAFALDASSSCGSSFNQSFPDNFLLQLPASFAEEPLSPLPGSQYVHMAQPAGQWHHLSGRRPSEMPGTAKHRQDVEREEA